jgi:hypothetical protein
VGQLPAHEGQSTTFSTALSAAEIKQLFNLGTVRITQ